VPLANTYRGENIRSGTPHDHSKELTGNGRTRKHVAVQELDKTLDRYEHAKEVLRIWFLNVAIPSGF
jgi:hypothetical protein